MCHKFETYFFRHLNISTTFNQPPTPTPQKKQSVDMI